MAVHEVGGLGCEEHYRSHEVLRCSPALCRCLRHYERIERVTASVSLTFAQRGGLRCRNVARTDAVALDVVLAVLGCDVSCEHLEASLGCGVSRNGLTAELGHHGAYVDDLSGSLADHAGNYGLGAYVWCHEVYVDDLTEFFRRHFMHRDALDDACVVDQDVNRTEGRRYVCNHRLYACLVSAVAYISLGIDPESGIFLKCPVHICLCAAVEGDLCACFCKSLSHRKADSIRSSGHQCHLAFE